MISRILIHLLCKIIYLFIHFTLFITFKYNFSEQPGIPGAPGSEDLANALKRLTPASIKARRAALGSGFMFGDPYDSVDTRTPDSIMSTGSISLNTWKTPNKLQVILYFIKL